MSLESPMIDRIKAMDIPTKSSLLAANYIRDKITSKVGSNKLAFDKMISLITETSVATKSAKEAELMFSYIVYEAVDSHLKNIFISIDKTVDDARVRTEKLMHTLGCNNPNSGFAKAAVQPGQPEIGTSTTKQRIPRGSGMSKKDRCIVLYKDNVSKFGGDKHKMIELFMKELGLTKPGATTYEYNCRKGDWK